MMMLGAEGKIAQRAMSFAGKVAGSVSSRTSSAIGKAINAIRDHLTSRDLTAAKRELAGDVVARKADGTAYDHVGEVNQALNSVGGAIDSLKKELGNESLSDSARAAVNKTMSQLSKYKDAVEEYLRR